MATGTHAFGCGGEGHIIYKDQTYTRYQLLEEMDRSRDLLINSIFFMPGRTYDSIPFWHPLKIYTACFVIFDFFKPDA